MPAQSSLKIVAGILFRVVIRRKTWVFMATVHSDRGQRMLNIFLWMVVSV